MLIACEAPLLWMKEVGKHTDYEYALAHHVLEDPRYVDQFKKVLRKGKEVILDNSAFELGSSFSNEKLMMAYDTISQGGSTDKIFVIAPDVLGDRLANHKSIVSFVEEVNYLDRSKVYATVQGDTVEERYLSYANLAKEGFSRFTIPSGWHLADGKMIREDEENRSLLLFRIMAFALSHHRFHLLGCTDLTYLPKYNKAFPLIVSLDTSFPVCMALQGNVLTEDSEKPSIKINDVYTLSKPEVLAKKLIKLNIEAIKALIS